MPHRILLVDDNPVARTLYREMLDKQVRGLSFDEAQGARQAVDLLLRQRYDCVFLDYEMPDGTGLDVLRAVAQSCRSPIVMLTATEDPAIAVAALKAGAVDFVMKERVTMDLLARALEAAVRSGDRRRLRDAELSHLEVLQAWMLQSDDAILIIDLTTLELIDASAVGLARLGFRRGDVIGHDVRSLDLFASNGGWEAFLARVQDAGQAVPWAPRAANSDPVPALVSARTVRVGERLYLVAQARPA